MQLHLFRKNRNEYSITKRTNYTNSSMHRSRKPSITASMQTRCNEMKCQSKKENCKQDDEFIVEYYIYTQDSDTGVTSKDSKILRYCRKHAIAFTLGNPRLSIGKDYTMRAISK